MKVIPEKPSISIESYKAIVTGSYEDFITKLNGALQESQASYLDSPGPGAKIVATFDSYFVASDQKGEFYKFSYAMEESAAKISLIEKIQVPVLNKSTSFTFKKQYSNTAIDSILSGNIQESVKIIGDLIDIEETYPLLDEQVIADSMMDKMKNEPAWKVALAGDLEEVARVIGDADFLKISERALNAKYMDLYNGTIEEEKFESYREDVVADMSILSDRLEVAHSTIESVFYPFQEIVEQLSEDQSEDTEELNKFNKFMESFMQDMTQIRENLAEALENAECVMCLAQIHDIIAEEVYSLELFSKYVSTSLSSFFDASAQ